MLPIAANCSHLRRLEQYHCHAQEWMSQQRCAEKTKCAHARFPAPDWEALGGTSSGNTNAIDGGKESISDSPGHMLKVAEGLPYCTKVPLRAGGWPRIGAEL